MTQDELEIIDGFHMPYNKFFIPLAWAVTLASECFKEGVISDKHGLAGIMQVIQLKRLFYQRA